MVNSVQSAAKSSHGSASIGKEANAGEEICLTLHVPTSAADQHSIQPLPPLRLGAADPHPCLHRGIADNPQSAVALLGPGPNGPVVHGPGNLTLVPFLSLPQGVQLIVLAYLNPTSDEAALLLRSSEFTALRSDVIVQAFIQATLAGDNAALARDLASLGLEEANARARVLRTEHPDTSKATLGLYALAAVGGAVIAAIPDMGSMAASKGTGAVRGVGIAMVSAGFGALFKRTWQLARWCLSVRQVNADHVRLRAAHATAIDAVSDAYFAAQQHRRSIMRVGDDPDATPLHESRPAQVRAGPEEDLSQEMAPLIAQREESIIVTVHGEVDDESARPAGRDASAETKLD